MERWWLAGTVAFVAASSPAVAQVQCSVLSEAILLTSFSDNIGPGGITPQSLRNFVCSVYGSLGGGGGVVSLTPGANIVMTPDPITGGGVVGLAGTIGAGEVIISPTLEGTVDVVAALELQGTVGQAGQVIVGQSAGPPLWATPQHKITWEQNSTTVMQAGTDVLLTMGTLSGFQTAVVESVRGGLLAQGTSGSTGVVGLEINGTSIAGCGAISLTTGGEEIGCTSANTITAPGTLTLVVVSTTGTPEGAFATVSFSAPGP
jgi:hypothetical protein